MYFLQSGSSSLISNSLKPCTSLRFSTCSVVRPFEQSARRRCTMSAMVDTAASEALIVGMLPSNASEVICVPPELSGRLLRKGFWRVFLFCALRLFSAVKSAWFAYFEVTPIINFRATTHAQSVQGLQPHLQLSCKLVVKVISSMAINIFHTSAAAKEEAIFSS